MTGSTHVLITKFLLHKYTRSQYFLGSLEFCHNLEWILLLPCPFPQISLTSLCARPQLWHTLILMTGPLSSRHLLWALVLPHLQDVQMPRIFRALFHLTKSNVQSSLMTEIALMLDFLILFLSPITDFSWHYFLQKSLAQGLCLREANLKTVMVFWWMD